MIFGKILGSNLIIKANKNGSGRSGWSDFCMWIGLRCQLNLIQLNLWTHPVLFFLSIYIFFQNRTFRMIRVHNLSRRFPMCNYKAFNKVLAHIRFCFFNRVCVLNCTWSWIILSFWPIFWSNLCDNRFLSFDSLRKIWDGIRDFLNEKRAELDTLRRSYQQNIWLEI
jgi:hypothetical protein